MTVVFSLYLCTRNSAHNYNFFTSMTKEEFKVLQLDLQQCGMSITKYLQHVGVNYNTYNYWCKKLKESESPKPELAPISFTQYTDPVLFGKNGALAPMLERILNAALEGEMDAHLSEESRESGNRRNGKMSKTVQTQYGEVTVETPRDRDGSFDPQTVRKRETIILSVSSTPSYQQRLLVR